MILPRFLLREAKENFGLSFYTKAQQFTVEYYCKVRNVSPGEINISVILPVPPTTNNQNILEQKYSPPGAKLNKDRTIGNKFVFWETKIKPREEQIFSEEFLATISPIKINESKKFIVGEYKNTKLYLNNEKHINFKNSKVKLIAQKARLRKGEILSLAKDLYYYVVKNLEYGQPIENLYSSVESLTSEQTDCGGFSSLLTAMLRYYQIPARLVSGYLLAPSNSSIMHAWVEFMLPNGNWIPADPTIENLLINRGTKRSGKFGFIGSDHLILSYGSDLKLTIFGNLIKTDILQNPIVQAEHGPSSVKINYKLEAKLIS